MARTDGRPQVAQDGNVIAVTFLTYSFLGQEAIYRHTDTYNPGNCRCETERKQIAKGAGGFVF